MLEEEYCRKLAKKWAKKHGAILLRCDLCGTFKITFRKEDIGKLHGVHNDYGTKVCDGIFEEMEM